MIKKVHGVFKGINAQAMAAMSLFLQYLRDPSFSYIQLEAPHFEDFNLVFTDGHKIICECKAHKKKFNYSNLRTILTSVSSKNIVAENDEILIICEKLDKGMQDKVRNYKYFEKFFKPEFERKRFNSDQLSLLPKVRFWITSKVINRIIVESLFSELLDFWLPETEVTHIIDSLLIQKIYYGSESGQIYKKSDILNEVNELKNKVAKDSGYFDKERVSTEKQLKKLTEAIKDNRSPVWAASQLKAISAQPNLMYFVIDKLKTEKINNIKNWDKLWKLNRIYGFSFNLFKIFENNMHNAENVEYILKFIVDQIPHIKSFYRDDFFTIDAVRIVSKILSRSKRYANDTFIIVKKLLDVFKEDYFYLKENRNFDYKKEEVCKLLKRIYENADKALKKDIYKTILAYFNLVKDEGEHSHYTPIEVFNITYDYLMSDRNKFELCFKCFCMRLAQQYERFYKRFGRKVNFNGWELMGGATGFWGDHYKIDDRNFVKYVLEPALYKYYTKEKKSGWEFIKGNCIISDDDVDKRHPDFLNRAALKVILDRYKQKDDQISNEAFEILKDFVLRRKGIPHKSELIYQALNRDFDDEKKWKLVSVIIERYKTPTNPFVECIISDLANKGHQKAKEVFGEWAKNSDYYKKTDFLGRNITQHIDNLLDSVFEDAIEIFKDYINNKFFIDDLDDFDAYKVAHLLGKILRLNFNVGIDIINDLQNQKQILSNNQQILLSFGVLDAIDKKVDDPEFVRKVYNEFIDPFLTKFNNDINKVLQKISHSNAREAFAQIAEKLAKDKLIKEALRIIGIFASDPDPFPPGKDPEDPEAKYSHHKKIEEEGQGTSVINSVRGWCAWTLAHCTVLEGREYLYEIIELAKRLAEDNDYYVQHMACFPLSRLVHHRFSHMPEDKNTLFFNDDKKTALEWAKKVETIAQSLLDKILSSNLNVQKALAKSIMSVVGSIRTLNEKEAAELIEKLRKFPDEETSEITSLLLYYAEFRKDSFKDWQLAVPGLYDDLQNFSDNRFKIMLREIMLKSSETKAAFAWQFYRMTDSALRKVKHSLDYDEAFELSIKYIRELILKYDHRTFETVYRFIEENIKQPNKFEACYALWLKCLEQERPVLKSLVKEGKTYDISWWPYYYNSKILVLINEKKGQKAFLEACAFLSKYPKEVNIGLTGDATELLKKTTFPNVQVETIFNNLIERNVKFYDEKQQWMKQSMESTEHKEKH